MSTNLTRPWGSRRRTTNVNDPQAALAKEHRVKAISVRCVLAAASLAVAYVLAFEVVPGNVRALWGPYLLAPLGWVAAGSVTLAMFGGLTRGATPPRGTRRDLYQLAAIAGLFLVAGQLLVGVISGFGRSPYSHAPEWLAANALWAFAPVFAGEAGRTVLLRSVPDRWVTVALVVSSVGLAALRFPVDAYGADGVEAQSAFWAVSFLPSVTMGLLAGIFAREAGVLAAILIAGPIALFAVHSPVLPSAPWPVLAFAGVAAPALAMWLTAGRLVAGEPEARPAESVPDTGRRMAVPSLAWIGTTVVALAMFWFSFGYFGYLPAFVPSHSMDPTIRQGDVVIVRPVHDENVNVGDVLLYRHAGGRILHRVIAIQPGEDGERQFITRGDNNNTNDLYPVTYEQVMGVAEGRIAYIGWVPITVSKLGGLIR